MLQKIIFSHYFRFVALKIRFEFLCFYSHMILGVKLNIHEKLFFNKLKINSKINSLKIKFIVNILILIHFD
jgi:hypothetical protein